MFIVFYLFFLRIILICFSHILISNIEIAVKIETSGTVVKVSTCLTLVE